MERQCTFASKVLLWSFTVILAFKMGQLDKSTPCKAVFLSPDGSLETKWEMKASDAENPKLQQEEKAGNLVKIPNMTVYEAHTSLNLKSEGPYFIPNADHSVEVNGKKLTVDDIVFGYDLLYEQAHMFSMAHFMGMYLQQDPNDAFALHDLFWRLQPDLLIELGTDSGGSAIFYSSFMRVYNPESLIITIDPKHIDEGTWDEAGPKLCPDCTIKAKEHFLWNDELIHFIHGKPTDPAVLEEVKKIIADRGFERIVVMEDGWHVAHSVLGNINAYEQFVTEGSYLIVQDSKLDRIRRNFQGPGAAVKTFLENQGRDRYVRDNQWEYLLYSQHHGGFLRKIKE